MATTNSWSAATIAKLKNLFDRGLSTAEIGRRLGFTKNAIVGKINRLGLNADAKKKPAAPEKKKKTMPDVPAKKAPKKIEKSEPAKKIADSKKKSERIIDQAASLMALRSDQCRWPLGNPDADDFRFCGQKCFVGKPYCFEHCKVAYQFAPTPTKKK